MAELHRPEPQAHLSVWEAVAIVVGLVVGVGIFRAPSYVANGVSSEWMFILVWVVGGLITWVGALCYAELAAAYPHAGGEYHFLSRAYGTSVARMFGWARCTIIQTGSIAAVAYLLGDYAAHAVPLGEHGPAVYAALSVIALTAVNVVGAAQGKRLQIVVTLLQIGAMLAIIAVGLFGEVTTKELAAPTVAPQNAALGMAMIFVLLTYGGWNEASYLTGELKDPSRNIARVLTLGTAILVVLYVLANLAMLAVLGLEGLRASDAVAADMMRLAAGPWGDTLVTLAIVVAAISTLNATIFTGARAFYAVGRDIEALRWLGEWDHRRRAPVNGQMLQALIALALIGLGAVTHDGFKAMVDYTAPVFWMFLLLVGIALFVLRWRSPRHHLPYRVPLYPFTPIVFCLTSLYMLYASVAYTGAAALMGVGVLLLGAPILLFKSARHVSPHPSHTEASLVFLKNPRQPGDTP